MASFAVLSVNYSTYFGTLEDEQELYLQSAPLLS